MSEEAEEQQNAWHDDFTTASQWEIFIAKLEEAIYDWKLPQFKASNAKTTFNYNVIGDLKREESNIFFSDVEFIVTHFHRPIEESAQDEESASSPILDEEEGSWGQELIDADILDETGDGDGPHPIERWYGIHHFLVLAPAKSSSAINSESQAKLLLSSAQIAISNSRCPIPIFVQLREPRHFFFIGAWEGPGVRTEFNMVHLRNVPRHCRYLTGLLDVFKGKLSSSTTSPSHSLVSPVQVSARLRFCLKDWPMNLWTQLPPDLDLLHGQVGVEHIGRLPFGAEADPISELHLLAQWRCLPESVLVDRDGYSDLAPTLASRWSLRAILAPPRHGLLTTTLSRILSLCTSSATLHQLLGDLVVSSQDPSDRLAESLSLLTETRVPSFSKLVSGGRKSKTSTAVTGPIPHQMLMAILYFLFPDAEENQSHPYPESFECEEPKSLTFKPNERISAQMKSAPCDSLLWRLAIVTGLVVDSAHGGLKAGAHLWHELAQEMRYRWEHSISIPGVAIFTTVDQFLCRCKNGNTGREDMYEEYEWAGQRRVRAASMLMGGYTGAGLASSQNREDEDGDDLLVVDGDDSTTYGPVQYTEADIVVTTAEGGPREQRERQALRDALISPEVSRTAVKQEQNEDGEGEPSQLVVNEDVAPSEGSGNPLVEALKMRIRELEAAAAIDKYKCLICMERFRKPVISICCWHVHCEECWLHTLGAKKLCPQCNMITSPADLRRIFL